MATLIYTDADGVERSFMVGAEPVVVGRVPECHIRSNDPRVSRNHARFIADHAGNLYIEDLGSSNGVYVGAQRVQSSMVPFGELVVVGSLLFRLAPPTGELLPRVPGLHGLLAQWLEMERKARAATEEERNAYGTRMAELHQEIRAERTKTAAELAAARERIMQLEARLGAASPTATSAEERAEALAAEVESYRDRFSELEDQVKAAEARARSLEEELDVARADLLASEDRLVTEVANTETRLGVELTSRVEELEVTRNDLTNAEERIVGLLSRVAELEQQLAQR